MQMGTHAFYPAPHNTPEALYKMKVRLQTANVVLEMTPASTATAQNVSETKMWTEYLKEAEEE